MLPAVATHQCQAPAPAEEQTSSPLLFWEEDFADASEAGSIPMQPAQAAPASPSSL